MNIGKKIAERRKELGLTQEALADKLSLSLQAVSRWENRGNGGICVSGAGREFKAIQLPV